jgi:hypothetical protein
LAALLLSLTRGGFPRPSGPCFGVRPPVCYVWVGLPESRRRVKGRSHEDAVGHDPVAGGPFQTRGVDSRPWEAAPGACANGRAAEQGITEGTRRSRCFPRGSLLDGRTSVPTT